MTIRLGASAVIVRDDQLLLVEFDAEDVGVHYNLPGGGVEDNELLEETCMRVDVERVLFVFEYVPTQQRYKYGAEHSVNVIFECLPHQDSNARLPDEPDEDQIGVRWVPLKDLPYIPLLPQLGEQLIASLRNKEHYPTVLRETI